MPLLPGKLSVCGLPSWGGRKRIKERLCPLWWVNFGTENYRESCSSFRKCLSDKYSSKYSIGLDCVVHWRFGANYFYNCNPPASPRA